MSDSDSDSPDMLAAGHALGSLTSDETVAYEEYLASSAAAREEANGFEAVAATLDRDAPEVTPPAALKERVMAQIAVTPQLSAHTRIVQTAVATPGSVTPGPAETRARSRWTRRPTVVLVAAAAAVVLFAGGAVVGGSFGRASGGVSLQQAQSPTRAQIVSSTDSQRVSVPVVGGGSATLVWSGELGTSALFVEGLRALPEDRAYELW